jgi:hypothetical protein
MDLPVRAALEALGVRHLLLGVHDPAFPTRPEEDVGRGTPYGRGGDELLEFARGLGFTGLQLGPQGLVSETNASPYDGTLFSRNAYSIALGPLTESEWGALLPAARLAEAVAARPPGPRVAHLESCRAVRRLVIEAANAFRARSEEPALADLADRIGRFRVESEWLERDAAAAAGEWPGEAYAFAQFVAHEQHAAFRRRARGLGLVLFGDLQVGMSVEDEAAHRNLFLRDYLMGAPPSRTNPEGQAWGYPVLDPALFRGRDGRPGRALAFLIARLDKVFTEFDSLRIDHPHGLVCPWVYRADAPDPHAAVRVGARLFESPDLPDHPGLARHAIARPEQIRRDRPRHADGWVESLDDAQVDRYAILLDALVATAARHGCPAADIACEVLSTLPHPLDRVRRRHGLGRFRITQKVGLDDPADVYRTENARPEDWVMLGTHDTPPIWRLADEWVRTGASRRHAEYLSSRLVTDEGRRAAWVARVAADARELAQAKLAELFVGPARQAMVFFTDLFGFREPYNRPGTVDPSNWSLRIPPDFAARYAEDRRRKEALDLAAALAAAIEARGAAFAAAHAELVAVLRA